MKTKLDPFFNAFRVPDIDIEAYSRHLAENYFSAKDGEESLTAGARSLIAVAHYFTAEKTRTVTPRPHRQLFLEIILITSGSGIYESAGTDRTVSKGDLLFIGHYLMHRIKRAKKGFSYISIRFMPEAVDSAASITRGTTVTAFDVFAPFYPEKIGRTLRLTGESYTRMLIHFLQVLDASSRTVPDVIAHALRALVYAAAAEHRERTGASGIGSLSPVFMYIREHIAETVSLADLAERSGMSRTAFSTAFNRAAGMSLPRYINELRIEQAKQLLRSSRLSVSAIAARTGFASDSFFIREFKKRAGMTPIAFRTGSSASYTEKR